MQAGEGQTSGGGGVPSRPHISMGFASAAPLAAGSSQGLTYGEGSVESGGGAGEGATGGLGSGIPFKSPAAGPLPSPGPAKFALAASLNLLHLLNRQKLKQLSRAGERRRRIKLHACRWRREQSTTVLEWASSPPITAHDFLLLPIEIKVALELMG